MVQLIVTGPGSRLYPRRRAGTSNEPVARLRTYQRRLLPLTENPTKLMFDLPEMIRSS
jgi:hypothetical protein